MTAMTSEKLPTFTSVLETNDIEHHCVAAANGTPNDISMTQIQICDDKDPEEATSLKCKALKTLSRRFRWCFRRVLIDSCILINKKIINQLLVFVLLACCIWLVIYIMFDTLALPGGICFSLLVLVSCAHGIGFVFQKMRTSALLGMSFTSITDKYIICGT